MRFTVNIHNLQTNGG
uniref:Uncharacterized protein n=1 Tax=Anopheles quadriannulatus TaxID=34691 RepID=A0A182XSX8_ANOQN